MVSSFYRDFYYLSTDSPGSLISGEVHIEHFKLLISLSTIRSMKAITALEEFYVSGRNYQDILKNYNMTRRNFILEAKQLQDISKSAFRIYSFIFDENQKAISNKPNGSAEV